MFGPAPGIFLGGGRNGIAPAFGCGGSNQTPGRLPFQVPVLPFIPSLANLCFANLDGGEKYRGKLHHFLFVTPFAIQHPQPRP